MVGWLCGYGRPSVLNSCCHLKSYLLYSIYIFLCVVKKTSSPVCLVLCKYALWPLEMEIRPRFVSLGTECLYPAGHLFNLHFHFSNAICYNFLNFYPQQNQAIKNTRHFFAEALPWPVYLSRSAYLICCCFLLDFTPLELTPIFLLNS